MRDLRRVAVAMVALSVGCSDAGGEVKGGGATFDASPDTGPSICDRDGGPSTAPHAWSDLYRDYFGPAGKASCTFASNCHGGASERGAITSKFVCGATADDCYAGMTSPAAGLVAKGDTTSDPASSLLFATLRKTCGGGAMPREPATVSFDPADLARIAAWMREGAPKN